MMPARWRSPITGGSLFRKICDCILLFENRIFDTNSWTWRSLERSRGYECEIRICSNKRQSLVHDFRTFRNSSDRNENSEYSNWSKIERTSRGIKIIEVLNGLIPRSLFKGTASGYELILEMFILNIKKVHHQIRNHIRYLNRKNGKQGRSVRQQRFFANFWRIFLFRPKIKRPSCPE